MRAGPKIFPSWEQLCRDCPPSPDAQLSDGHVYINDESTDHRLPLRATSCRYKRLFWMVHDNFSWQLQSETVSMYTLTSVTLWITTVRTCNWSYRVGNKSWQNTATVVPWHAARRTCKQSRLFIGYRVRLANIFRIFVSTCALSRVLYLISKNLTSITSSAVQVLTSYQRQ